MYVDKEQQYKSNKNSTKYKNYQCPLISKILTQKKFVEKFGIIYKADVGFQYNTYKIVVFLK